MEKEFTWIPFYKEMAQKLLQFKNNRLPLVNWIYRNLDSRYISHLKDNPKGDHMTDIDPFTVFAIFNRSASAQKRIDICSNFKNYLNIKAAVPQDFVGIPIMLSLRSNFIGFRENRKNGDIKRLWDLFDAAVSDKDIKTPYDALNGQFLMKKTITMGLFWIRPDRFLPLDGHSQSLLRTLGIDVEKHKFIPYDRYNQIMKQLNAKMKNEDLGYNDYPGFSAAAYMAKDNDDDTIDDNDGIQYWMYSPGEYARMWDDCVNNGIMCLGWDELGDLSNYKDRERMRKKMIALYGSNSSYKNDSLATWQFANDIQEGDIVFAKKGLTHIVGRGVVESDYVYDSNRKEYVHTRKVRWTNIGDWETEGKQAMKTLTDITSYPDYVDKLNIMIDGDDKSSYSVAEPEQTGYQHYWWLVANPKIWSLAGMKIGEEQSYTLYNENGHKRKIFQNFLDAKAGDIVIGYEASPTKQIVSLLEIPRANDGKSLYFRMTEALPSPIDFSVIKNTPELENMEFLKNNQGSFYKLTPDEFDTIMDLVRADNPLPKKESIEIYDRDEFLDEVFMSRNDYDQLESLLLRKKNLILQGAPGVGKTFAAKRLAYSIMGKKDDGRVMQVQFHQNYSYEDFVMGYKPNEEGGFELKNGMFYKFCKRAAADRDNKYFFIIDEINRGNLSKIFGELLMLIENDYRDKPIQMSYKDELFSVPDNLYLIGMMNTADRSLAMIDYALRRRFSFFEMKPGFETPQFKGYVKKMHDPQLNDLANAIIELNHVIENDDSLGAGFCIGHSYLCNLGKNYDLTNVVEYDIIPMLREYWFDNNDRFNQEADKLRSAIR